MEANTDKVSEELLQPKLEPISPAPSPPISTSSPTTPPLLSPAEQSVPSTEQPALPPTIHPEPFIKPEFSLVPVRAGVPTYHLVHQGPAPPGWETDPAWQKNRFNIDEPIYFKNEYFRFQHNTGN